MILITGSTGYIGSHISLYFEKNNIDFVGIDNLSYSSENNVKKKQKHYFFDISNEKKLIEIFRKHNPKTIIHCAANSYVLEAETNKKKYFLNNVIKTKKFIDICKKKKLIILFLCPHLMYIVRRKKHQFFLNTTKLIQKIIMEKIKL